ncbi:MFS transporter [Aliihoeflea sp. 40Bstr573]|uniref:MFS transporter n=1 Tax=Aliihoeflea sp. 40Bstr573 TaxID=2696467 RepID=UPI002095BE2C|nr:MFS transporter [Aliihoeflea sp. 40Bstr573]MCO6385701.1 MFS transporter [Aliihoeflea sp. 40Bstr573]
MVAQVRHPIWLPAARAPGARTFAILFTLESFARASVASVIPIQAYELLRSEQSVSLTYTVVALLGLSATILMPLAIQRFARRRVYTAGVLLLGLGSLCLVTGTLAGQLGGMLARVIGASALSITLNLYIMDHIRKTQFIQSESLRMAWSTIAWMCGPTLGVTLYSQFGLWAAHGAVAIFAAILLCFFWYFRLSDNIAIRPGKTKPANPLANIGRFLAQPRLRLAWFIAFGRSCFWTSFFVYAPLLMVVTGQGSLAGGLIVSAGNALLFTALLWGRLGARFGARRTMAVAFAGMAVGLTVTAAAGEASPWVAGAFLLVTAFFGVALDALGSVVFMRAVRSHERAQMTAVYRTYLDLSELMPPLVYSIVLIFFGLGGVFASLAILMAVCAVVTWHYLPRRI